MGEIVDLGAEKGIIDKAGAWFSFRGERMGQGREGAKQFLRDNPEIATQIRALVMDSCAADNSDTPVSADSGDENEPDLEVVGKSSKNRKKAVAANE
jgi:recombination protein RecA